MRLSAAVGCLFLVFASAAACDRANVIDGMEVGPQIGCKTGQFVGSEVKAVEDLWPAGPPPIAKICTHNAPSKQLENNLAGRWYIVIHLEDGTRHARMVVGVGECMDCKPPVDY